MLKSTVLKGGGSILVADYFLGVAYKLGIMTMIDSLSIKVLDHVGGNVGIGHYMLLVRTHSHTILRLALAVGFVKVCELTERGLDRVPNLTSVPNEK